MKHVHEIEVAKRILSNAFSKKLPNHLYILVANDVTQQRALYQWYIKLHACEKRQGLTVCDACQACVQIRQGNYVNSIVVQKPEDKKSIGIELIHDLQANFMTTAQLDAERFFCIENADSLTVQAANSILKFLEEPQGQTSGFLFVKNEQALLPTIRSRGQVLRLRDEVDVLTQKRIAKKITNPLLQQVAYFLLQNGYEEKQVLKSLTPSYTTIINFATKLANGAPPIIAQTDLEALAQKTKTGTLILEVLVYILDEHIKTGAVFTEMPEHVMQFVTEHALLLYLAAYHAVQKQKYHLGVGMLFTSFSLELTEMLNRN